MLAGWPLSAIKRSLANTTDLGGSVARRRHSARCVAFQVAEAAIPPPLVAAIPRQIERLRGPLGAGRMTWHPMLGKGVLGVVPSDHCRTCNSSLASFRSVPSRWLANESDIGARKS
jgi:hypothetical protein